MKSWQPTQAQVQTWEEKGYFTVPGVATADQAAEMRGVIKNILYTPEPENVRTDADPMDPMGDTPEARAQRFRKFNRWCHTAPLVWHTVHAGAMAPLGRYYLGAISCSSSAASSSSRPSRGRTPWHRHTRLWRDGETDVQLLDGRQTRKRPPAIHSGKPQNRDQVLYADSIHGELPRERVAVLDGTAKRWHYSPVNRSPQSRIGIAGVYTTPTLADRSPRNLHWVMRKGTLCQNFPPDEYEVHAENKSPPPPFPRAD